MRSMISALEMKIPVSPGLGRKNIIMAKTTYEVHEGRTMFVKEMIQ